MAFPFAAAGLALGAGGLAASLLNRGGRVRVPDVSAELARIQALYEQARKQAVANIQHRAGQARGTIASNLAARGTLRSGVSENVFRRHREATGRDIATEEANIGAQQASELSSVLQNLLGANLGAQRVNLAQDQAFRQDLFGGLGSLGGSLLMAGLNRPGSTGRTAGGPVLANQRVGFGPLNLAGGGVQAPPFPTLGFQPAIANTAQGSNFLNALLLMDRRSRNGV